MKKFFTLLIIMASAFLPAFAANESASTSFSLTIPKYLKIESVLNPVLTAHITNRNGNLHSPLTSKFRVISNCGETTTLYLKAQVTTDAGLENAMFKQGGQVYVAFANIAKIPKSQALANCKNGTMPNASPGIVAYPVLSVTGAEHKFTGEKYEVYVNNGITYVAMNVGSQVLRNSFASNDTKGFYQVFVSLTEADI